MIELIYLPRIDLEYLFLWVGIDNFFFYVIRYMKGDIDEHVFFSNEVYGTSRGLGIDS
jgi:hypothetical protein